MEVQRALQAAGDHVKRLLGLKSMTHASGRMADASSSHAVVRFGFAVPPPQLRVTPLVLTAFPMPRVAAAGLAAGGLLGTGLDALGSSAEVLHTSNMATLLGWVSGSAGGSAAGSLLASPPTGKAATVAPGHHSIGMLTGPAGFGGGHSGGGAAGGGLPGSPAAGAATGGTGGSGSGLFGTQGRGRRLGRLVRHCLRQVEEQARVEHLAQAAPSRGRSVLQFLGASSSDTGSRARVGRASISALPRAMGSTAGQSHASSEGGDAPGREAAAAAAQAAKKRALAVVQESRVTSDPDWRAWDWHLVALLLDTMLPSPAVLEAVLGETVFMQRLGRAFLLGEAGLELPSESQWEGYSKQLFEEQTSSGLFGLFSGRQRSASTAAGALQRPSSVATMAAGGRPVVRATSDSAPSGEDKGAAQISRVPWTAASLRFARCARQWLVLLLHHPMGRRALLDTDAGAKAAASASETRPGDVLRELVLGLLRQSLPGGGTNPWHVFAGEDSMKELAANHAAAACPSGPPTASKVEYASSALIRWRFERCVAREIVTAMLGALTASE